MATFDSVNNIWKGVNLQYPFPSDVYFGGELLKVLNESPDSILFINHEENYSMTRRETRQLSINLARHLMKLDIQPDDVVGVVCRNSKYLPVILYACIIVGAPINPLDVSFAKEDIKLMYGQTKPKIVFCDADVHSTVKEALNELENYAQIFTLLEKIPEAPYVTELLEPINDDSDFVPPKFDVPTDEKLLALICTSGTTGPPKATCITHASSLSFNNFQIPQTPLTSIVFSPIYWVSGFYNTILIPFRINDTKVQTLKSFSIERFAEMIEKYQINLIFMPPSHLFSFLQSPLSDKTNLSSVRLIYLNGCMASLQLFEVFHKKFPSVLLSNGYGMTEITIANCTPGKVYSNQATVGSLMPNVSVKIVDDAGKRIGVGEAGEVCVKRPMRFLGYYNNPAATENVLDSEGFIKTGDIGYFNEDMSLMLIDRKKEVFKYNGYPINPSELEEAIQSIAGVKQVTVIGIPHPEFINLATAAVVRQSGFEQLSEEEIIDHVAQQLPFYKQLHGGVIFMDSLPMTVSGKVLKRVIRDLFSKRG